MPTEFCRRLEDTSAISCCPDLVVTLRKKMKSFEKFKRRMGLTQSSSRSRFDSPNNLPPLLFHPVHGENIRLGCGGARACRVESYCKGIVFSSRPVRPNERVFLRLSAVSNQWSGVVRLGFTNVDPRTHNSHSLPKYACPDLTKKPGYWAKAMSERYAEPGGSFFYYFTPGGDVHFGAHDEEKGILFTGLDTSRPLWCLLDVYGNATAVDLIDPRGVGETAPCVLEPTEEEMERWTRPTAITAPPQHQPQHIQQPVNQPPPGPPPMLFHPSVRGRNVVVSPDRRSATRLEGQFCNAYVFGERPLRPGQTVCVQLMDRRAPFVGSLTLGVTSCDPARLAALPDDADRLLDRPEYWALVRDAAAGLPAGARLSLRLCVDGRLEAAVDDAPFGTLMHVDSSLPLWPVFDLFGSTGRVRLLGQPAASATTAVGAAPTAAQPPPDAADCAICLDRAADAALYSCGHVCMCYTCAVQWKLRGGAACPICRAPIRDVIRLYRS